MHRERIEKIRDHLRDNVKDFRFDLSTWAGNDSIPWDGGVRLECGTTACAMGHATTIPEFRQMGLHLIKTHHGIAKLGYADEAGETFEHFEAAAKFLDIPQYEAEYLFSPENYANDERTTRMEVVNRISDYLLNGYNAIEDNRDDEPDYEEDE